MLDALRAQGRTLATAESCTAGLVAARLAGVPGASDVLLGGIVAYANEVKQQLLGVPAALLAEHGAVSPEVARAMAEGARRATGADVAVSVTGVAGPGGGTPEKPVGLVYLHVSADGVERAAERRFPGPARERPRLVGHGRAAPGANRRAAVLSPAPSRSYPIRTSVRCRSYTDLPAAAATGDNAQSQSHLAITAGRRPPMDQRTQALDAALTQIERQFGKGSIMKLGDDSHVPAAAISTGCLSLDIGARHRRRPARARRRDLRPRVVR